MVKATCGRIYWHTWTELQSSSRPPTPEERSVDGLDQRCIILGRFRVRLHFSIAFLFVLCAVAFFRSRSRWLVIRLLRRSFMGKDGTLFRWTSSIKVLLQIRSQWRCKPLVWKLPEIYHEVVNPNLQRWNVIPSFSKGRENPTFKKGSSQEKMSCESILEVRSRTSGKVQLKAEFRLAIDDELPSLNRV